MAGSLMRRIGRRDQQEPVELESFPDLYRSPEMAEMDRIKGTAKET